jgi:hypothetical protein
MDRDKAEMVGLPVWYPHQKKRPRRLDERLVRTIPNGLIERNRFSSPYLVRIYIAMRGWRGTSL